MNRPPMALCALLLGAASASAAHADPDVCVSVDSGKAWQSFDLPTPVRSVSSIAGSWTVDAASYAPVGAEGHGGSAGARLEPFRAYKLDRTQPFGALLVAPVAGEGHQAVSGPARLDFGPVRRLRMRINDTALGDNRGALRVCFSSSVGAASSGAGSPPGTSRPVRPARDEPRPRRSRATPPPARRGGGFLDRLEAGAARDRAAWNRFEREVLPEARARGEADARRRRAEQAEAQRQMEELRSRSRVATQGPSPYGPAGGSTGLGGSGGLGGGGIRLHSNGYGEPCELQQSHGGREFSVPYVCDDASALAKARERLRRKVAHYSEGMSLQAERRARAARESRAFEAAREERCRAHLRNGGSPCDSHCGGTSPQRAARCHGVGR